MAKALLPRPLKKTYSNWLYHHIYLTDKQLDFCLYYMFGIPSELRILESNLYLGNYTQEEFKENYPLVDYIPKYKNSSFLKSCNCLKYKYKNGLGSYMLAFRCKNYETAKRNSKRLLKNPYILLELYFMHKWSYEYGGKNKALTDGLTQYKTPLTLEALESGIIAFSDTLSINDLIDDKLKEIVLTRNWD